MAGQITIRKLVSVLTINATAAVKGLKAYSVLWDATAKGVEVAATRIEKAAARAGAAMGAVAQGAAGMRGAGGSSGNGGGGGGGRGGQRSGGQSSPVVDDIVARGARAAAAQAGLAAGARPVNDATAVLGRFSTASERAKAKVADLTTQVARNRTEMADLRKQVVQTGDADGTLAARMRGLAASTGTATQQLAAARRELRGLEGGLIDAVKAGGGLRGVLAHAGGNLLSGVASRASGLLAGAAGGAVSEAIGFQTKLVDVAKVAKGTDLTADGLLNPKVIAGIKQASTDLGKMPGEVAELAAQLTASFSGKEDLVKLTSDVTKIGVAWDVTGKQAGEFFKQTSAGLQITADETKSLFGTINELGNELGVKSSEIAEAMTRSAGVLKGANISGETGAALNAVLIKAGASAEVAATGVRTFVARLGAGEAATDKQRKAFSALGLSAEAVAKNLASGDVARAEKQIKDVVAALVNLKKEAPEKGISTLIELFGSESIGSIGAAATSADALATAFGIAGDKAAALTSVQAEYDRVSNTTAHRIEKLKANVAVLGIEFGEALLPHIDRVVNFLTSAEGKEWGASAVASAAEAVSGLASALGTVVGAFSQVNEVIGLQDIALVGLAAKIGGLAGPWGALAGAALPVLLKITNGLLEMTGAADAARKAAFSLLDLAKFGGDTKTRRDAEDDAYASAQTAGTGVAGRSGMLAAPTGHAAPGMYVPGNAGAGASADASAAGATPSAAVSPEAMRARFDALVKKRAGGSLAPSESKELRGLSKALDLAIPKRPGKGHKPTKMDRQLAAMDPAVRNLLRRGGEEDAGGDLKVADNILDRGAFAAATKGRGGIGGTDGVGPVGPGPSITNNDNRQYHIQVQQQIDASSNNPAVDNIRRAGTEAANAVGGVVFTGAARLVAMRNGGGRLTP